MNYTKYLVNEKGGLWLFYCLFIVCFRKRVNRQILNEIPKGKSIFGKCARFLVDIRTYVRYNVEKEFMCQAKGKKHGKIQNTL